MDTKPPKPARCTRCKGRGLVDSPVMQGRCFRCGGSGIEPQKEKVFVYEVILDDGHVLPHRAQRKATFERATEGLSPEDALQHAAGLGWQPYAGQHGGSGVLKVVSVKLVNIVDKLIPVGTK